MKDLDHQYPNGENYPVSDALIFWDFFKQASASTTSSENISIPISSIRVFPNPSNDHITIELPTAFKHKPLLLEVYNQLGEKILHQNYDQYIQGLNISKFQLGSGVFIAKLTSGKDKAITKLIFDY